MIRIFKCKLFDLISKKIVHLKDTVKIIKIKNP